MNPSGLVFEAGNDGPGDPPPSLAFRVGCPCSAQQKQFFDAPISPGRFKPQEARHRVQEGLPGPVFEQYLPRYQAGMFAQSLPCSRAKAFDPAGFRIAEQPKGRCHSVIRLPRRSGHWGRFWILLHRQG